MVDLSSSEAAARRLREGFEGEQDLLLSQLRSSQRITHAGDSGEVNEQHFIDFLRAYLPNRYTIEKAIVMDSLGQVSHSIDIVVFDRQYTPTLLDNDKHRYVPAEAVYAVFECKPRIDKGYLEFAGEKVASVRRLHRTSVQIHHAGKESYPPKPLFRILGGILATEVGWSSGFGEPFLKAHRQLARENVIDCGFAASGASFDVFDEDRYTFGPSANALAFFAFRLLSKLQKLATAPAADWQAYADRLSQ